MFEYEICKVCGFIRVKGKGGECEACGAREKAFIAYQYKITEKKKNFLKLDVHPVTVHFTEAYTATTLLMFLLSLVMTYIFEIEIVKIIDVLVIILPFLVLFGGITGIVDGKIRYKKLKTPYLERKIGMGVALGIISLIIFIIHQFSNLGDILYILEVILAAIGMLLASALGWFGSKLVCQVVPRGKEG